MRTRAPRCVRKKTSGGKMAGTKVLILIFAFLFQLQTHAGAEPMRRKILIIGMDGLRPDALLAAHIPNLRGLIAHGTFAANASADSITRSGPGWAGVFTGVWHDKNGVRSNLISGYHS